MARLVVLFFEDNVEAESFIGVQQASELPGDPVLMTAKPTLFCECVAKRGKGRSRGFTKGKKWGWWVCVQCKKPTKRWAEGRGPLSDGRNLLTDLT